MTIEENQEHPMRRECDNCAEHAEFKKKNIANETFKSNMVTGVKVTAFFIIIFLTWVVGFNLGFANKLEAQQKELKVECKAGQEEHKKELTTVTDRLAGQMEQVVKVVSRMESALEVLTETKRVENDIATKEIERNRQEIEKLKLKRWEKNQ